MDDFSFSTILSELPNIWPYVDTITTTECWTSILFCKSLKCKRIRYSFLTSTTHFSAQRCHPRFAWLRRFDNSSRWTGSYFASQSTIQETAFNLRVTGDPTRPWIFALLLEYIKIYCRANNLLSVMNLIIHL